MQGMSTAEKQQSLDSFLEPIEPTLELIDRSTLEPWAVCPMQAALREAGKTGPMPSIVDTGELVHLAFSAGVQEWISSNCEIGPAGIRQAVESAVRGSRPDLQPDAIAACRASIWEFSSFLSEINPRNIHAFDGGEHLGKSGQLAWDFPSAGVRLTSEIDFLWQTHAPDVLGEEDWKSGWKINWPGDIYKSFQFNVHAVLILNNYERAKAVDVTIWDVRRGRKSYPVRFERRDLGNFTARVHAALQSRYDHKDNPVPWPVADKCAMCQVARHCSASGEFGEIADDPAKALREYIAVDAKVDALKKALSAYVKAHGPIALETGERFAREHKSAPLVQLIVPKKRKQESENGDCD